MLSDFRFGIRYLAPIELFRSFLEKSSQKVPPDGDTCLVVSTVNYDTLKYIQRGVRGQDVPLHGYLKW